jgi:acyl-CoA reductase-like NAD-dependent aldehyde dehydrogenase
MIDIAVSNRIDVREPASGRLIGSVDTPDSRTIAQAVERAHNAQAHWARLPCSSRARHLHQWRQQIIAQGSELAAQISRENGKPFHEALLHDVVALVDAIEYFAITADSLSHEAKSTPRWFKHRTHLTTRRPRGVTIVLSPFNFPALIPGSDAASALAMGCAVIVKPSPSCPLVGERLVQLAHEAGMPDDLLQVLHGDAAVGRALVQSGINEVVFTGNTANGRDIAKNCGEHLVSCTLELGGNCPLLVLDDADIERCARAIAYGAFTNSGQSCLAVSRVLTPRRLMQTLLDRLVPLVERLRQGDPATRDVDLGALCTRVQVDRCQRHVDEAVCNGAQKLMFGQLTSSVGNFHPTTLLVNCPTNCAAYREETFGPVLAIVPYDDLTQAIRSLNLDTHGLAAYVFGGDTEQSRKVADQLNYGHVVIDQVLMTYVCPELPLAGLRSSGLGVVHGAEGMLSHTTPKVVGLPRMRLPSAIEFDWGNPARAIAIAETYLATKATWSKFFTRT